MAVLMWVASALAGLPVIVLVLGLALRTVIYVRGRRSASAKAVLARAAAAKATTLVAFFHPYCNAGGGGERVLWCAISALLSAHRRVFVVVFTGDDVSDETIVGTARQRFGVHVDTQRVAFVHLNTRNLVEADRWPRFTMLGQSLGSMVLALEALLKFRADVVIDSMGYAFTYPVFSLLGGCKVAAYVHYPTVSTDMLERVQQGGSKFAAAKVFYYRLFARVYGLVGSISRVNLVNSSWTHHHISSLWKQPSITHVVYPPCDTTSLSDIPLNTGGRQRVIVSLSQFRPEKNHLLQLQSFAKLLALHPEYRGQVKLWMIGGVRGIEDMRRVQTLQEELGPLGLKASEDVFFLVNIDIIDLKKRLSQALIGIHTMLDEHFGIGVVEFMAAGLITIAHNSAGPKMDIVVDYKGQKTGLLANTEETYAAAMHKVLSMTESERSAIQAAARASVQERFSEEEFGRLFVEHTRGLFSPAA
eukprot:m.96377 g.96377  ORF g.96377 m.96377 type:complete len:474 (-) comp15485_c0_seq1:41-1462(-)